MLKLYEGKSIPEVCSKASIETPSLLDVEWYETFTQKNGDQSTIYYYQNGYACELIHKFLKPKSTKVVLYKMIEEKVND